MLTGKDSLVKHGSGCEDQDMTEQTAFPHNNVSVNATAELVSASARRLNDLHVFHLNTADVFIQIFDAVAAADVTVGTTTADIAYLVPASDGTNRGALDKMFSVPLYFTDGIVIAVTTTPTGNTSPAAAAHVALTYS